jgi:hypothetical protein
MALYEDMASYSLPESPLLWRNVSPPSSGIKNKPRKKPVYSRHHFASYHFHVRSLLLYSSALRMETPYSTEMSVVFTRLHDIVSQKFEFITPVWEPQTLHNTDVPEELRTSVIMAEDEGEATVNFNQATKNHIPGDSILHYRQHQTENSVNWGQSTQQN